ncbi:MAG: hypothetical protein ACPGNT_02305 [Rhodospirillales bacterium]
MRISAWKQKARGTAWETVSKDGLIGFQSEQYLSGKIIRNRWDQWVNGAEGTVPEPNWQHPPVVGAFMAILILLWSLFTWRVLKRDRSGNA